ncbi:MAG: xanthine dehydrogenase family protein subunit M [Acidobacteria bacterium]|nr:xanthine dehydrogenase family protein subunit M [Acidobacteriota bacterium]
MKAFLHKNAKSVKEAVSLLAQSKGKVLPIAGGSDLLGEMKDRIETPDVVVNLKTIPGLDRIEQKSGHVSIGALVTISDLAESALARQHFPVLVEAASVIASLQIRNVGTVGGNLCQRPRCWYYRGPFPCLRKGGDICYAILGENRYHAILGGGPSFIVHPSDLAPALVALDARARIAGPSGERTISLEQFFVLPTVSVQRENVLKPNEILTEIQVPLPLAGTRSTFWKQMERDAWDFALVSTATVIRQRNGKIEHARVVLGGVAPIPWRSREAEAALVGQPLNEATATLAADKAMQPAGPLRDNAYKVDLSKAVIKGALLSLA